jgi:hypothetical protein
VAANDDAGAGVTSQVTFTATAGVVYQIAVDGYDAAAGTIALARTADIVSAASVSIAATDALAKEGSADAGVVTVTRTGNTSAALTVNLALSGTAMSGSDYRAIANTVTIPGGASSAMISITSLMMPS